MAEDSAYMSVKGNRVYRARFLKEVLMHMVRSGRVGYKNDQIEPRAAVHTAVELYGEYVEACDTPID